MKREAFIKQCEEGFKGIDQKNVERARELLELEIQLLRLIGFHRKDVQKVRSYVDDAIFEHRNQLPVHIYFERAKDLLISNQTKDEKAIKLSLVLALFKYSAFKQYCRHKGFDVKEFNAEYAYFDALDGDVLDVVKKFDFSRMKLDSMVLKQFSPSKDVPSFTEFNHMVIERVVRNNLMDSKAKDPKARAVAEFKIRLKVLKDVIESSAGLEACDHILFDVAIYTKEVVMKFNVYPKADPYKLYQKIKTEVEKIEIPGVTIGCARCANLGDKLMLIVDFTYEGVKDYELPLDFEVLDRSGIMLN